MRKGPEGERDRKAALSAGLLVCGAARATREGVRPDKRGRRRVAFLRRERTAVPRGAAASQPPA